MKKEDDGLQKHTLNLYPGEYQKLRDFYPDIGAGAVIRRLVHQYIKQIELGGEASLNESVEIKI